MIRQEKLLSGEGRGEALLGEVGGVLVQEGMQGARQRWSRYRAAGGSGPGLGHPVALLGEGVGGQADAAGFDAAVELVPVKGQALDPEVQQFGILSALDPFVDRFLQFFIRSEDVQGLLVAFNLPPVQVLSVAAVHKSLQFLLEFFDGARDHAQAIIHGLTSHLERVGQIGQGGIG